MTLQARHVLNPHLRVRGFIWQAEHEDGATSARHIRRVLHLRAGDDREVIRDRGAQGGGGGEGEEREREEAEGEEREEERQTSELLIQRTLQKVPQWIKASLHAAWILLLAFGVRARGHLETREVV